MRPLLGGARVGRQDPHNGGSWGAELSGGPLPRGCGPSRLTCPDNRHLSVVPASERPPSPRATLGPDCPPAPASPLRGTLLVRISANGCDIPIQKVQRPGARLRPDLRSVCVSQDGGSFASRCGRAGAAQRTEPPARPRENALPLPPEGGPSFPVIVSARRSGPVPALVCGNVNGRRQPGPGWLSG